MKNKKKQRKKPTKTPNSRLKDQLLDCLKRLEMKFPLILLDCSDIDPGVLLARSAAQKFTLLEIPPETHTGNVWGRFVLLPSSLAYSCQRASIK